MPRVVHFEIYAEDTQRAQSFYEGLFGWTFHKWPGADEYWTIVTGPDDQPGINGGMLRRLGGIDGHAVTAYVCTADVADLAATGDAIEKAGGAIVVPRHPVPGIGWLLYANDTEGNVFGVMQADATAK